MTLGVVTRGSKWPFILGLTLLVVLPIVTALMTLLRGEQWFPGGDMAQAELHMRGFFLHPPLVGSAGRIVGNSAIQGSHPGPSLWVALLPVYLIGGRTSASLMTGVVSVHTVSVLMVIWLAYRRAGKLGAGLVGMLALLLIRSSGTDFMIEPWNPWLAFLPFMVFVLVVSEVVAPIEGTSDRCRLYMWLGAIVVGSHCVQSHVGYLLLVVVGLLVGLLAAVIDRHQLPPKRLLLFVGGGGSVAALMWLPVVIDQWRRSPGNLSLLWQHFGSPDEPTIALGTAIRILTSEFNIIGPWLTGPGSSAPSQGWARYVGCLAMIFLWSYSTRIARRQGWQTYVRLQWLLLLFVLAGAVSVLRLFGPFFEYTIRWFWIFAALSTAHSACGILARWSRIQAILTAKSVRLATVGIGLVLIAVATLQASARVHLPGPTDSRIVRNIAEQLDGKLPIDLQYLVRFYDPYTLDATGFGTVLELERRGYTVGVEAQFAAAALPHRVKYEQQVDTVLWVVVGPANKRASADTSLHQVAFSDPRSAADQKIADSLLLEIARGLQHEGREDLLASLDTAGASLLFAEPPLPPHVGDLVRHLFLLGQPVGIYEAIPGTRSPSLQP